MMPKDGGGYTEGADVESGMFAVGNVTLPVVVEIPKNPPVVHPNPKGEYTPQQVFSDVPTTHQFFMDIAWLADTGITTGYSDGTFRPSQSVERAAMAAYFYRMAGSPEVKLPGSSPFKDVDPSFPFYKEIVWMHQQGITTGWPDGTFRPHAPVERQAMAAFFHRYHINSGAYEIGMPKKFSDVDPNSPFAGDIAWMSGAGITTGWSDGTFRPHAPVERQAMAAFIHRYEVKFQD